MAAAAHQLAAWPDPGADFIRRLISVGGIRSRAHSVSARRDHRPPRGRVGDLAEHPIHQAQLVRSWVSNRSAISTRNTLPTSSAKRPDPGMGVVDRTQPQ